MKVLTFNAQGSRVIVHVKTMKIYVATMEMLRKNERHDEIQFPIKIGGKLSLGPNYFLLKIFIPH
jgi:hypothetical protein